MNYVMRNTEALSQTKLNIKFKKMKNPIFNRQRWILLCTIIFFSSLIFAQNTKTISGTVTEDTKDPVIGANVLVKGKTLGTITNIDGKYTIQASPNDIIVFSFIGLESKEVKVEDQSVIDVTLNSKSQVLQEVVAIGYGVVKKSDLTGSVAVVTSKELTRNPSASAAQALQGKATGVLVSQSGAPGGKATIRVRGVGTISKGADPIYILDGVEVSDISNIQPQDIESFQVLKDASATAIYGANGSNGVIIITTKRGKSGKPVVNLNSYLTMNLAPKQYDVMNADEYSSFYSKINSSDSYSQAFREAYYGTGWQQGTNWQSEIFKSGVSQNHNVSISGGGENSNFNVSLAYNKDNGTVIHNSFEHYNLRANSDFKLSKYIKVGENINVGYGAGEDPYSSGIWDLKASPLMKIYNSYYKGGFESYQSKYWNDSNGNITHIGDITNTATNDKPNPLAVISLGLNRKYGFETFASVYAQVDFTDWLMFKVTPSANITYNRTKKWLPSFGGNRSTGNAELGEIYSESIALNLENQLLFKKTFNKTHNVQATAVYQIRSKDVNSISGTEVGFDFEELNTLSNGQSPTLTGPTMPYKMISYLGRFMYDYKGKYYATASFRSDGVSVFAPNYRRGNFSSGSLAWKISEDFLKNIKEIDMLKLRLGWGQTGNSNIGDGFQYYDQISSANNFYPVFGVDQSVARAQYAFAQFGSKEIHWESAEMTNVGFDLNMFNSKLQATAEYYIKKNDGLLVQVPISYAFGRNPQGSTPWYNSGKIQNSGLEMSLQWRDKVGKDFNYGITSTLTTIKNKVTYLPVTDITTTYNRTIVGHSIGSLYGFVADGIVQFEKSNYNTDANGNFTKEYDSQNNWTGNYLGYRHASQGTTPVQPGDFRFKDLNNDGVINDLDKTIIGKTIPSFTYTLSFDCSYKSFDFNIFLLGVSGFDIYNAQRANMSSMNTQDMGHNKFSSWALNPWTFDNPSTANVRVDQSNANFNDRISSFWVEDGSFLRIKDIQVGYTLSQKTCKNLGLTNLRIYGNASNLYCFTAYKGRDPEGFMSSNPLSSGVDNGDYSVPRSFTIGLQVGF